MLAKLQQIVYNYGIVIIEENEVGQMGFLRSDLGLKRAAYLGFKRAFDVSVASVALVLSSPIFLIVPIVIKLDSKGPVFFKHKRVGKNGQTIYLYKFRSMREGADKELEKMLEDPKIRKEWEANYKIHNDPRVTRLGRILRVTSIDELPQIINVFKGDMSLIGPRPLVEDELKKYGANREKFLSVTPGVTGWWACKGRSAVSYEDRMELELFYVEHQSLKLDFLIIWYTFWAVLKGHGAE